MFCCGGFRRKNQPQAHSFEKFSNYYEVNWEDVPIGKGGFSEVYRGINRETGNEVAVKKINRIKLGNKDIKNEIKALLKVKGHEFIVELHDVFVAKDAVFLCLEFMEGGPLYKRIVERGAMSEVVAKTHFRHIAQALQFLHSNGVVHRDFKPENLIFASSADEAALKLSDFGLSKICPAGDNTVNISTFCGTLAYLAPEQWAVLAGSQQYGPKVDTWSFGVTLYVCLAGYHPFDPKGTSDIRLLRDNILGYKYDFSDPIWQRVSSDAIDLIRRLLCPSNERLSAAQVCVHPWIVYDTVQIQQPVNQQHPGKRPPEENMSIESIKRPKTEEPCAMQTS